MPKRLTRQESQARTQAQLMAAGARVFARAGFEAASVEEIAEAAGFSRGAFYANFQSKEDLFLAILEERRRAELAGLLAMFEGDAPLPERLAKVREHYAGHAEDRDWCLLSVEFQMLVVRNPKIRERVAGIYREYRAAATRLVAQIFVDSGVPAPAPPETLAAALMALSEGLSLHQLVDPKSVSAARVGETLDYFFSQLIASQPARSS